MNTWTPYAACRPVEPMTARDIVLVVDDSPGTLGMLTDAIEEAGLTVLVAVAGNAALSLVEKITPDVILLDAIMPGMDGFETCRPPEAHSRHRPCAGDLHDRPVGDRTYRLGLCRRRGSIMSPSRLPPMNWWRASACIWPMPA